MRLTQLLSKNQQVQYLVFEYFLHHTQEIALKELAQEIHVSLPTLQKELVSLEEELKAYAPNARLEKNANDDYALILPADF
nr:helix-turn-helix domain-containing protein [Enterococcus sp.]